MSTLIVEVSVIDNIQPHDNADRLEIATVKGWQCVVMKGKYKKGDKIIYIPIDSMIPFELSEKLGITKYLENKKKDKSGEIISLRVKTIKLRGVISQGLIIDVEDPSWQVGDDVKDKLGIKKYIPKFNNAKFHSNVKHNYPNWRLPNYVGFNKYTDIENFYNFLNVIKEGEEVVATEKIHGTNSRMARLNVDPIHFPFLQRVKIKLKKIGSQLLFGLYKYDPSMFMVGSHNCNIKMNKKSKYVDIPFSTFEMDVYWKIALEYELDKKLKEGEEIFGEIYGKGIQKYFEYDGMDKIKIKFFDMKIRDMFGNMNYLDWDPFVKRCNELELPIVPVLYRGPFSREILHSLVNGESKLGNNIREGCVIKPVKERFDPKLGRVILKCISDQYLLLKGKKEDELIKKGEEGEIDIFTH